MKYTESDLLQLLASEGLISEALLILSTQQRERIRRWNGVNPLFTPYCYCLYNFIISYNRVSAAQVLAFSVDLGFDDKYTMDIAKLSVRCGVKTFGPIKFCIDAQKLLESTSKKKSKKNFTATQSIELNSSQFTAREITSGLEWDVYFHPTEQVTIIYDPQITAINASNL